MLGVKIMFKIKRTSTKANDSVFLFQTTFQALQGYSATNTKTGALFLNFEFVENIKTFQAVYLYVLTKKFSKYVLSYPDYIV